MTEFSEEKNKFRFSPLWILPLATLLIGGWMVGYSFMNQGPTIEVTFATAEGLKAGETRVKRLSVDLGIVEEVYLNEDYGDVTAVLKLDRGSEPLLREDTQFWVVRPRLGSAGISGLSTLLSGAFVELSPGVEKKGRRAFKGLDDIPLTPQTAPGTHLRLTAERAASLSVGSPVLYNGYRVGRVESASLSTSDGQAHYGIFVDAPYNDLISANTRFWNASGINVDAGTAGLSVHMESLEALVVGGVAFGLPEDADRGAPVAANHAFRLYPSQASINEHPYEFGREYLLLFDASVRGLALGAPVEYRGIRLGTVLDVSFDLVDEDESWTADGHALMPVLIRIDPGRFGSDSESGIENVEMLIANGVDNGLRASLASGNLLTGARYISLDFQPSASPASVEMISGYPVLPTSAAGLENITLQVSQLLDKIQGLPLKQTLDSADKTLHAVTRAVGTADDALHGLDNLLEDPSTKAIPASVNAALIRVDEVLSGFASDSSVYAELEVALLELRRTLQSTNGLTTTLEAKPSALLFGSKRNDDPQPEVRK